MSFFINLILFVAGFGALAWAYLAFSPMTRDIVAFLSREQQIRIFKYRKIYWSVGILLLTLLLVRVLLGVADPGGSGTFARVAATFGQAHWLWLVPLLGLGLLTAFLYWAMYVPVVMAPPKDHRLVDREMADEILEPDSIVLGIELEGEVRAYPRDLIARPHWFNDDVGGRPLMVSYCILCNSGQA